VRRTLAIFRVLCFWRRLMPVLIGFGILSIGVELAIEIELELELTGHENRSHSPFGFIWLLILTQWSGGAFRQLASNRVLSLAPGFRTSAVSAMLLFVACAGLIVFAMAAAFGMSLAAAVAAGLTVFSLVGGYFLLWQWLCTFRAGTLLHFGLIIVAIWLLISRPAFLDAWLASHTLLALATLLGWVWLYVVVRRPGIRRPLPGAGMEAWSGRNIQPISPDLGGLSRIGPGSAPAESMMRGMPASIVYRVAGVACMFAIPAALGGLVLPQVRRAFTAGADGGQAGFVMAASFMIVAILIPLAVAEWPVRLRYVWLRSAGDRARMWHAMERSLLEDVLIIAGIATLTAIALRVLSGAETPTLVAYVVDCAVATLLSAYFAFSRRARGDSGMKLYFLLALIWIVTLNVFVSLSEPFGPQAFYWPLPVAAALVLRYRLLARRRLLQMDWCAVKPLRGPRPGPAWSRSR